MQGVSEGMGTLVSTADKQDGNLCIKLTGEWTSYPSRVEVVQADRQTQLTAVETEIYQAFHSSGGSTATAGTVPVLR